MPLAPVDDKGTQLYFEDSGAPPGCAPYPTLVLIHGTGFHGAIYSRMLSVVGTHNARGEYAAQTVLMQERGLEIAAFLTWFIAEYDVVTGGVSLLGWSHGPSILLAFLAHADKLSVQTRTRLDAYLRTFILHGESCGPLVSQANS
ncbi:hypothetical protein B0H21DRAFT_744045 [Amylocystis lapponica]|nr:hypothetical protein B0H21DRAFT_744045 [Amylocystis lapponica]